MLRRGALGEEGWPGGGDDSRDGLGTLEAVRPGWPEELHGTRTFH